MMHLPTIETLQRYREELARIWTGGPALVPLAKVDGRHAVRSGLVAGAALAALSAASAAVTARRERSTRS